MTVLSWSFGSISPEVVPSSCSYCPTLPNFAPSNAGEVLVVIGMLVIRASAGAPTQISGTSPAARAQPGRRSKARSSMAFSFVRHAADRGPQELRRLGVANGGNDESTWWQTQP